jgi:hypothetical protein
VKGNFIRIGHPSSSLTKLIYYAIGLLFVPLALFYPDLAVGMVAKKILKNAREKQTVPVSVQADWVSK